MLTNVGLLSAAFEIEPGDTVLTEHGEAVVSVRYDGTDGSALLVMSLTTGDEWLAPELSCVLVRKSIGFEEETTLVDEARSLLRALDREATPPPYRFQTHNVPAAFQRAPELDVTDLAETMDMVAA